MMFEVERDRFSRAVTAVSKAVPAATSLPVLHNILLDASGNAVRLTATNLEYALVFDVPAVVKGEVKVTVPGHFLKDFVKTLPKDVERIKFIYDAEKVELTATAGVQHSRMKGISAEEFPLIKDIAEANVDFTIEFSPHELSDAIFSTAFAASTDFSRPTFVNLHLFGDDGLATIEATDGYRLTKRQIAYTGPAFEMLIPATPALAFARMLRGSKLGEAEMVTLAADTGIGHFYMAFPGTLFTGQIYTGTYPKTSRIVPSGPFALTAELKKSELERVLRLAAPFVIDAADLVVLDFAEKLTIRADGSVGDFAGELDFLNLRGDGLAIHVNVRYLLDCVKYFPGDVISVKLLNETKPLLFQTDGYLHLLMPMAKR